MKTVERSEQSPVIQNSKFLASPLELRHQIFAADLVNVGIHVNLRTKEILRGEGLFFSRRTGLLHPSLLALTCGQIWDEFNDYCKSNAAADAPSLVIHTQNFCLYTFGLRERLTTRIRTLIPAFPVQDRKIVFRIFLTHDMKQGDAEPLLELVKEVAECLRNGFRVQDFEILFDRLIVDVTRFKQTVASVRKALMHDKLCMRTLFRIEKAMIVAMRRELVRSQRPEEETRWLLSFLPFFSEM